MRNILRLGVSAVLMSLMGSPSVRAQDTNLPLWEACQIAEPRDLSWEYRWRWRAEQNLTCIIQKLNQAIAAGPQSNGAAVLSHQELQQLSNLAWAARDAAQRIGR